MSRLHKHIIGKVKEEERIKKLKKRTECEQNIGLSELALLLNEL